MSKRKARDDDRSAPAKKPRSLGGDSARRSIRIYAGIPTQSLGSGREWPKGWIETHRKRCGGSSHAGKVDKFWHPPHSARHTLRSLAEVQRYLAALEVHGGDDELAKKEARNPKPSPTKEQKVQKETKVPKEKKTSNAAEKNPQLSGDAHLAFRKIVDHRLTKDRELFLMALYRNGSKKTISADRLKQDQPLPLAKYIREYVLEPRRGSHRPWNDWADGILRNTPGGRCPREIQGLLRYSRSAEILGVLERYGPLTKGQIQTLLRIGNLDSGANFYAVRELRQNGYVEIHGVGSAAQIYSLSHQLFGGSDHQKPKNTRELARKLSEAKRLAEKKKTRKSTRTKDARSQVTVKRPSTVKTSPLLTRKIFSSVDLLGKVMEYLDAETLFYSMARLSKTPRSAMTYQTVMRASRNKRERRLLKLMALVERGSIFTPSPLRILAVVNGKRCEHCNVTKTPNVNDLGLLMCFHCTKSIVRELKPSSLDPYIQKVAIAEDQCAKIVRTKKQDKQYFVYDGEIPLRDGRGEAIGPIVSLGDLKNVVSSVGNSDSNSPKEKLRSIIASINAHHDSYQSKIPGLRCALEKSIIKYNHHGIIAHSGPNPTWIVLVQWENGVRKWENLEEFAIDDPETCVKYARENSLPPSFTDTIAKVHVI